MVAKQVGAVDNFREKNAAIGLGAAFFIRSRCARDHISINRYGASSSLTVLSESGVSRAYLQFLRIAALRQSRYDSTQ